MPDRSHGVNDELRGKFVSFGEFGIAGLATTERPAFFQKLRTGGAVNRAVNASAAEQRGICGV